MECDWDLLKADSQPDIQCPFNPSQYKLAAIEGSLPWAFIQMYLGKKVHRNGWHSPDEYLYFVPKGKRPDGGEENAHIEIMPKDGHFESWTPTQEDLMACDWKLVKTEDIKPKPVDCMLSFDLKIEFNMESEMWGYNADTADGTPNFGILINWQNKIDITKFSCFAYDDSMWGLRFIASSSTPEGYQKMVDLFAKKLTVTVGGVSYHLPENLRFNKNKYQYIGIYRSRNDDVQKLSALLQQNVGKTLHFCLNWN
ncbi:Thoeris anti-defense Tad2 family protein [Xenorhabdus littoralis]|uniref:Thoeris anti-defense Tad2 family protein n=1 Tax=Xenorhabdus littoralis TaxID=2582835 RepID=UPI003F6A55EA